ncbi:hypothetical protein KRP22_009239 [Phytophthora ramorum]|uniref:Ubiquitin-like-conjugating enzyme ATG10 n=1 Tax=Phytophthora ramorum TaxID=164328 RepID=UPI0030A4A286|nr:Ubiquitin-like-conjugating enzyme ATG10 [Phytophthora ramorum]KAH7502606.1 Ubiquitin-like-conjugating enzyme ATG10 [Phytophthora ramorum]
MREGSLSYTAFCVEAELLHKQSHEVARKQSVGNGVSVATWQWRHGNRQHLDGNSYLVSTGNSRQYMPDAVGAKISEDMGGHIDDILLAEEDTLLEDDDVDTTVESKDANTALLEFHIVYHTIYQTPVLYFRALAVDGTPLPDSAVTLDAQLPGSNGRSTFVAIEQHPVLGKPFSFLHPCETAAAMQLLQDQVRTSTKSGATTELEVPQYLASWLSLVQPLTGISPHDYFR